MSSGDLEVLGMSRFLVRKGAENPLLCRTFVQKSDLLKVLGTVFGDLGAVATGDLHGRRRKGPRPSGTGGKTPAKARPKGHHSEGRKLKPRGKNYKELQGITRNYQKLQEITRSGRIPERGNLPLVRPSGKNHFFGALVTDPAGAGAGDLEIMRF